MKTCRFCKSVKFSQQGLDTGCLVLCSNNTEYEVKTGGSLELLLRCGHTELWSLIKQKFSPWCVMVLTLQLAHNTRSSIGYQTAIDAHKNKEL